MAATESTAPSATRPLPGSMGLPLLGETLTFVSNPFGFFEERVARHGAVFKTRLMGRRVAVMTTPDALEVFIDPERCQRTGAMPGQVLEIFAGQSLPTMDGASHEARKQIVLAGFTREALAGYLPAMEAAIARTLSDGAKRGELRWLGELKRLAFEVICRNVIGLDDDALIGQLVAEYGTVARGLGALPIKLPFATFGKALKARDRALAVLRQAVVEHREKPGDDGLSRILAHKAEDGTQLANDDAVRELHHVVLAGYIIFGEFVATLIHLDQNPELLAELRAEVDAGCPDPLTPKALASLPLLGRVVMETKRVTPIVPVVFAKARRDFDFKGHTIPRGWTVLWALQGTLLDPATFTDPHTFDPERYAAGRAEHERHPHGFVPQGAGPDTGHKCPGISYATLFMQAFTALLVRDYEWTIPAQDLSYGPEIPSEPRDGLRATLRPRA